MNLLPAVGVPELPTLFVLSVPPARLYVASPVLKNTPSVVLVEGLLNVPPVWVTVVVWPAPLVR
jgi:hypothetical protein